MRPRRAATCAALASALLACHATTPESRETTATEAKPAPARPDPAQPQYAMDYGPFLSGTIRATPADNIAVKGVAVPLGEDHSAGIVFDTELLRASAGWVDGYLELTGTPYDGAHGPSPKIAGTQVFGTVLRPGIVADDSTGDPRPAHMGPLPREQWRYLGLYRSGARVVFSYEVMGCGVLESPGLTAFPGGTALTRTFEVQPHAQPLRLRVADEPGAQFVELAVVSSGHGLAGVGRRPMLASGTEHLCARLTRTADLAATWGSSTPGSLELTLAPSTAPALFAVHLWRGPSSDMALSFESVDASPPMPLAPLTKGGPSLWDEPVVTAGQRAADDAAYVVDTITVPYDNPWHSRMRLAGLDFFRDGRAAVSTWNGDVWVVSGIDADLRELRWRRFATGLFDPLGLRIVDDIVYTLGRDGITRLHDLDGDGEADFYECFNHDVLATKNFHEFAFDLQTDAQGNFYFAKAGPVVPGGRGFDPIAPHHGCVLEVSKDGSSISVYATGLRAPNGIGVGPDGQVTSGDNQGTWMPRCRLNWIRRGDFLGCVATAHRDPAPEAYDPPLCWLPMEVDNSGGGQVWVTSDRWGPFRGSLLHMSYGTCSLFAVLPQEVDGVMQGGVARFPLSFASSCMRARFHPVDGQLYVCGLQGWQTSASLLGALQRVRYTGKPAYMPIQLAAHRDDIALTFTEPLDAEVAADPESWTVEQWNYVWSDQYGSPEVATVDPEPDIAAAKANDDWDGYKHHEPVAVQSARLSADGRTVTLAIAGLKPVMQMRIRYDLDAADGTAMRGEVVHTIHRLPPDDAAPQR